MTTVNESLAKNELIEKFEQLVEQYTLRFMEWEETMSGENKMNNAHTALLNAYRESLDQHVQWTRVEDGLPEPFESILIADNDPNEELAVTGWYESEEEHGGCFTDGCDVIENAYAWALMPKKPGNGGAVANVNN